MAAIVASAPQWVAEGGISGPRTQQVLPAQTASWREGDILAMITTGTIVTPPAAGTGALAGIAGPGLNLVTLGASASAGAPAAQYYGVVTYAATGAESLPSTGFVVNVPAGFVPTVNVSATGAPGAATSYNAYLGYYPASYAKQNAAIVALGTAYTGVYPLTNSSGVNRAAAGASTGIIGVADCDSDAQFYSGVGGSILTGKRSPFGATQSVAPGWTNDTLALPVMKLQLGQLEMNLVQPWYPSLRYAAVGINIDGNTGYFVADTTQTAIGVIESFQENPMSPIAYGNVGDTGARITVKFNASALV